jgi:DNA-binding CsgD family transcriptional regulator
MTGPAITADDQQGYRVALVCPPGLYADALRRCILAEPGIVELRPLVHIECLLSDAAIDGLDAAVIVLPDNAGLAVVAQPGLADWARGAACPVPGVTIGWQAAPDELQTLVRVAAAGLLPAAHPSADGDPLAQLTSRECEILGQLCVHGSASTVAEGLGISEHTVRTHIGHILSKLHLHSRLEAVIYARRSGLNSVGRLELT